MKKIFLYYCFFYCFFIAFFIIIFIVFFSSINSNVGEKNYDLNYGHINENIPAESHSASCHSSRPSTSKNLDHLYTQVFFHSCIFVGCLTKYLTKFSLNNI